MVVVAIKYKNVFNIECVVVHDMAHDGSGKYLTRPIQI